MRSVAILAQELKMHSIFIWAAVIAAVHRSYMGKEKAYSGPDEPLVLALKPKFKKGKSCIKYAEIRNVKKEKEGVVKGKQKRVKQDTTLIVAEKNCC